MVVVKLESHIILNKLEPWELVIINVRIKMKGCFVESEIGKVDADGFQPDFALVGEVNDPYA